MDETAFAQLWLERFYELLRSERVTAERLRVAMQEAVLGAWTSELTSIIVKSFTSLGFPAVAKGHRCSFLPVRMHEYLGQDIMVFPSDAGVWMTPVAVCELENALSFNRIAYSLWKVLCIRSELRVVLCYGRNGAREKKIVQMANATVTSMNPVGASLPGTTLLVIGLHGDADQFPYAFFHAWQLNSNTMRFEQMHSKSLGSKD